MHRNFDTILIATGSEVNLAVSAAKELASPDCKVRVVNMPSTDVFDKQRCNPQGRNSSNEVRRRCCSRYGCKSKLGRKYDVGLDERRSRYYYLQTLPSTKSIGRIWLLLLKIL